MSDLRRWGKAEEWSGLLLCERPDGYWTPWHLANALIEQNRSRFDEAVREINREYKENIKHEQTANDALKAECDKWKETARVIDQERQELALEVIALKAQVEELEDRLSHRGSTGLRGDPQ